MTMVLAYAGLATLERIARCAPAQISALEGEYASRGLAHVVVIIDLRELTVQLWRAQLCRMVRTRTAW